MLLAQNKIMYRPCYSSLSNKTTRKNGESDAKGCCKLFIKSFFTSGVIFLCKQALNYYPVPCFSLISTWHSLPDAVWSKCCLDLHW